MPDNHDNTASIVSREEALIRQGELLAEALNLREPDLALIRAHRDALAADRDGLRARFGRFLDSNDVLRRYLKGPGQRTRLIESVCDHFHGMLDANLGRGRIERVLAVGEKHFQLGIPQVWVGAGYAEIVEHLESRLADMAPRMRNCAGCVIR